MPDPNAHSTVQRDLWSRLSKTLFDAQSHASLVIVTTEAARRHLPATHGATAALVLTPEDLNNDDGKLAALADTSVDAVLLFDSLHRLDRPMDLLAAGERILKPGGEIAVLDPGLSLAGWVYHRLFNADRLRPQADPMETPQPVAGNPAYTWTLFCKLENRIRFMERFPGLRLEGNTWAGMAAFALTGGQAGRLSLIPAGAAEWLIGMEDRLRPFIGRWLSYYMLTRLRKRNRPVGDG